METNRQYALLDFGEQRKLERFGRYVLDRPAPAVTGQRLSPQVWKTADARFELSGDAKPGPLRGVWNLCNDISPSWPIHFGELQFELKLTDFGHVGVFPEQSANWGWLRDDLKTDAPPACGLAGVSSSDPPTSTFPQILNLFAYTGGSTLAAAAAGAAVTHVDAAGNVVAWARRNAELSGLADAPIRWIVEDALKFARRELKRGRRYNAVILDPPSYGHGPSGEVWKIDEHLPELLRVCRELTGPQPRFVLLSCHAPNYDPPRLAECLSAAGFTGSDSRTESGDMWLTTPDGRQLHSGAFARNSSVVSSQ